MTLKRLAKALTSASIILGFVAAPASFAAVHKPTVSNQSNTPSWNQKHSGNSKSRQAQNPPLNNYHGKDSN